MAQIVLVAVMGRISGGKLTRGVRRTPLIVLVAGGEGWEMGGCNWEGFREVCSEVS